MQLGYVLKAADVNAIRVSLQLPTSTSANQGGTLESPHGVSLQSAASPARRSRNGSSLPNWPERALPAVVTKPAELSQSQHLRKILVHLLEAA